MITVASRGWGKIAGVCVCVCSSIGLAHTAMSKIHLVDGRKGCQGKSLQILKQ